MNLWLCENTHKLHIQVADVVMEIAFERIERLKISEGNTHPIGAMFLVSRVLFPGTPTIMDNEEPLPKE